MSELAVIEKMDKKVDKFFDFLSEYDAYDKYVADAEVMDEYRFLLGVRPALRAIKSKYYIQIFVEMDEYWEDMNQKWLLECDEN